MLTKQSYEPTSKIHRALGNRFLPTQIYDNGGAGIHIMGSTNFKFDATIGDENDEGDGYVGSLDGQQPIEVIVESSTRVIFQDMSVRSANGENVLTQPGFFY